MDTEPPRAAVDLFWIPLGAGGAGFVRFNGRVYEAISALLERRPRCDLYHTALEVLVGDARFVIENTWPIPDRDTASRGVVVEGPVFSRRLFRFRALRYEIHRWRDGIIPDAADAVASPQVLARDPVVAQHILDLAPTVPVRIWGRDQLGAGEMWNSNSVISFLLARAGLEPESIEPPAGGRAPGWHAGVVAAG